ncbi:hypothetical protein K0M31_011477 [Melipona bicolor]|uniref:Uncharacterized protein n=1 Tax=Melipona bicolor TaxID=60889 RepID=A0AA40KV31_9HYME|nr:hypothetical protein K0M31_011477 [Melipona bicolor]
MLAKTILKNADDIMLLLENNTVYQILEILLTWTKNKDIKDVTMAENKKKKKTEIKVELVVKPVSS